MVSLELNSQNETKSENFITDIQSNLNDSKWYWFFLSIFLTQIWVIFLTLYNSRVIGLILTAVLNKFWKLGHIQLGSFSFSVLSGKIMFRDVHVITEDFSMRIQYGWIIFKWWRPYTPKTIKEDLSHSESRVAVFLDDFEFHIYNRSGNYAKLEKLFSGKVDTDDVVQDLSKDKSLKSEDEEKKKTETKNSFVWRDLIPVIKVEINSGRVVFGNHLVPYTMIVKFEDGNFVYTTKPASTPFDVLMHDAKGKAENFKIMFVPSPKYHGPIDEPPRNMGEGFVVLQTGDINVHFFMDQAGTVPYEPESVQLADGETLVLRTYPCFGVVAGFGKNTDFNYGPWADRQRELLWKFFYPSDYQDMVPTIEPKPGELRQFKTFEFRMNMYHMSTIDILFSKNSETQAIHMNASPGSYLEMNVPWIVGEEGYVTTTKGQLLLADVTTSLQYRSLIECETFEFTVKASYPMTWNDHQDWVCDFIACKATVFLIFHLKHFFKDLMEDWSTKSRSDIFHFVPYTWTINFLVKEFELVLLTNEYNWVDTSSSQTENAHIAFAGQTMELSLVLPYTDYLPPTVHIGLIIKGENAYCRFYLPETNTSRHIVQSISKNMKIMDRNGKIIEYPFKPAKPQWRRFTLESDGWIDCWTTTHVALSLGYTYHPMPITEEQAPEADTNPKEKGQTTPQIEDELLIPLWPVKGAGVKTEPPDDFDPANMEPDLIALELEVAPSMLCVYGSLLRNFLHVKENYLGEDQVFTDFYDPPEEVHPGKTILGDLFGDEKSVKPFDERDYRPFAVTVSLAIHDIHGHLVKNCNIDDLPCPSVFLERLCFEMDKNYLETKLQLLLSPAVLVAKDTVERNDDNNHLNEGHLGLSGLQVRGHAMFSHEGLPLDSETLEYGWLVEATIGQLTGRLTSPQVQNLVEFLQTFITLVEDSENCLIPTVSYKLCQHMLPQPQCRMLPQYSFHCPTSEDIKYVMTRVSVDSVNFFLVETGTALNVQLHPIKLSTCNLHGTNTRAGITARIENIALTQFMSSSALKHDINQSDLWLESGGMSVGPIDVEAAMALPNPDFHKIQDDFMKLHDEKTKRLWFLWPTDEVNILPVVKGKCGCHGGCAFFGNNKNGIGFFNSKKNKDKPYSAVLKVSPADQDPGFGQSLLFKDKLVFEVNPMNGVRLSPSRGNGFKFTRGYMSNLTSPESGANITVIEDTSTANQNLSVPKENLFNVKPSQVSSQISFGFSSRCGDSDSCLEDKNIPVPFDVVCKSPEDISMNSPSDSKSLPSIKNSLENFNARSSVASNQLSDSLTRLKLENRKSGSDFQEFRQLSEKSLSKASLPTPKMLRQDMGSKISSEMSLESERYYSADEDVEMQETTSLEGITFEADNGLDNTLKRDEVDLSFMKSDGAKEEKTENNSQDTTVFARQDSSESSLSTLSYESANTDYVDGDSISGVPENFLVDLHGQVQKPISESPVLMSCYSSHLTHFQCNDWSQSSDVYNRPNIADQSSYSLSSAGQFVQYVHRSTCVPSFTKTRQGFTPNLMKTREDYKTTEVSEECDEDPADLLDGATENPLFEEDPESNLPENASITTAVVKVRGCVNVMITPLFLESFQRYTEAVIPTLRALHPSSIIDGLHSQCLDTIKRQNRLKKAKKKSEVDPIKQMPDRQFSTENRTSSGEMKTSSLQALFTLSKINICVLQSGMVEEVIAFQAMESISDLTCVSLLAVCFDDINCQLLSNNQSVKTSQDKSGLGNAPLKTSPKKQKAKRVDSGAYDKSLDDSVTEISREEDVGTLHISRIHIQLQRLLKNSNFSDEVLLTAIPEHKSKVLFEFDKEMSKPLAYSFPASPRQRDRDIPPRPVSRQDSRERRSSYSRQSSVKESDNRHGAMPRLFRQGSIDEESLDGTASDAKPRKVPSREQSFRSGKSAIGFIMVECGLENIDVKAVRRLGFSENVDEQFTQKMDKVTKKLNKIQSSTRIELERELGKSEEVPKHKQGAENKNDNDSVHSWDSRISLASSSSTLISSVEYEALKGDASSGMLEIKTIWFNFAAPPAMSIKNKVDFTKHDWNLLSTCTPAINAWMNPLDRLICSVQGLILTLTHRTSSAMACIMTDALEDPSVHFPRKSKYYKITPLARILVEEPSCQLFTVLRKYLYKVGTAPVEKAVNADTLPQLITIQKGILALTRQWKNVLYMPQLSEMDFKSQKTVRPYTVKFALPLNDDLFNEEDEEEDELCEENFDIVDERVSLLTGDEGSIHKSGSISSFPGRSRRDHEASSSVPSVQYKKLRPYFHGVHSQSFDSPEKIINGAGLSPIQPLVPPPSLHRNDSNYSFHSAAASLASMEKSDATPPPTPMRTEFSKPSILKNTVNVNDKTQDLYQWMSQQQDEFEFKDDNMFRRQDSLLGAFGSAWSQEDSKLDLNDEQFSKATSIMQLADARNLFKPFLQSIGLHVEGVRPTAMMKKFGGSLSLQGQLDEIKIQIVKSERRHRKREKSKKRRLIDFNSVPAFLCEGFLAHIAMNDVVDFENKQSVNTENKHSNPEMNFAMHKLEAKPTTLQVNFMMNCTSVTQHIDMPLLRLVHQIVTMAGNIKETKTELKQSHSTFDWVKTHRKQDSKCSTSSADTQQSDVSHSGIGSPHSTENLSKMKDSTSSSDSAQGPLPIDVSTSQKKPTFACIPITLPKIEQKRPERLTLSVKKPNIFQSKRTKSDPMQILSQKTADITTPPQSLNYSDSVAIDMEDMSSPIVAEKTFVDEIKETTPKCWRTLYHLLELYSTMPETKTFLGRRPTVTKLLPVIVEEPEGSKERIGENLETPPDSIKMEQQLRQSLNNVDEEKQIGDGMSTKGPHYPPFSRTSFRQSIYVGESITLVVFGIAKVETVRMQALLSGLKLEAEMKSVHASGSYKEKAKGFLHRKSSESSVTAHIGNANIVLLEGLPPDINIVVKVKIDRSLGLHTTILRRGKEHNSAMVSIGAISVDIPQHPVVLHGMMTRSSRELSSTLLEFRRPMSRAGRNLDTMFENAEENQQNQEKQKSATKPTKKESTNKPTFLHIHIKAIMQGITIGASLLPSLKAQYKTDSITVSGITGKKAHFNLDLPSHTLSFKSKVVTTETSIPSSASIDLPPIHMYADYRSFSSNSHTTETLTEGLVWKEGSYLNAVAEVGMLNHSLSTDLLNHLVFVQKVFMKEVNELVQKVSGTDQPVPLWVDEIVEPASTSQPMLYSLLFRFKGIQITATTPTSSAVRLETGSVDLEISNRVQMAKREESPTVKTMNNQKMFIKAQIDLNVALGQLLKNALFEEAEPEFQTMAFFKTKIAIRNALQDEMIPGVSTDQEALLIKLTRPIILIQPVAFDKAVLVWLNYKNAYEYWTEQRMALNTEVQTATRQVIGRIPQFTHTSPTTFSTLYLQVTVDDMGICVPVETVSTQQSSHTSRFIETDPQVALVMTLRSTQISACSSGSLVSKGKFQGFCLRFANDFETSWDDWKPDLKEDPVMNACVVPEGTYEVCSRTINKQASDPKGNAKWILNVQWDMKGIDVHLDTNIGKRLSSLGGTLTALAGEPDEILEEEEGSPDTSQNIYETEPSPRRPSLMLESLPSFVYDTSMDPKQRFRLIEKEMNEQARIVQDLRQLGASLSTIETEARKLEELKSIVFRDFRREILSKLKKQGESRTSALKDQLGIGNKPTHSRSKSYADHHHRRSHIDVDRLSSYNQQHKRIGSLDISKTLPARVKFGQTLSSCYSPPGTPTSLEGTSLFTNFISDSPGVDSKAWKKSSTSTESSDFTDDETPPNRNSDVFDDKDGNTAANQTTSNPSIGSGSSSKVSAEPNIDFELDVKVFIDSGKCVLHPKDSKEDEQKRQSKREKTPTMETSPQASRKYQKKPDFNLFTAGQGRKPGQQQPPQIENTVFFMPSVDVKVHYNSKTTSGAIDASASPETEKSARDLLPTEDPFHEEEVVVIRRPKSNTLSSGTDTPDTCSIKPKPGVKKAKLYAWLSLQSLPEEMIISPYLMDFLEQALEPIPIGQPRHTSPPPARNMDPFSMLNLDLDASTTSLSTALNSNSFPVDVVVFIRVEPSIIRFNCTPVSRVECLLQVPSLDVVFSTRGSDVESHIGEGTPPMKPKGNRERNWSGGNLDKRRTFSTTSTNSELPVMTKAGGLSFTGRLSDFSLYIFHPYGGAQRKMASPSFTGSDKLGSIQEHGTAWSEMSRRDMLSLNVEFIKVTISRSRKLEVKMDLPSHQSKHDPQLRSNVVRFSAVCDIGTAAFKYDMRRLSEILTFPKAWYNRNLTRRLFLGEESFANMGDEEWDSSSASSVGDGSPFTPASKIFTSSPALNINGTDKKKTHHRRGSSGDKFRTQLSMELKNEIDSKVNRRGSMSAPQSPTDIASESGSTPATRSLSRHRQSITPSETPRNKRRMSGVPAPKPSSSWETLVMFAVNLSQLDLRVNMSNVMGNTVWSTKNVKSQGRLSIDCSGHKDLKITAGMDNSHFDSKGGVVGGTLEINNLSTFFEVKEDPDIGKEPSHRLGLSLFAIECRMDYMGTSVLMTRLSKLDIELKDEWHVETNNESDSPLATTRPGFLFAHGELGWDQFHIMISRSTTPDIFKMVAKIEEFITMQFTSSRRVLSAFGPIGTKGPSDRQKTDDEDEYLWDIKHHRHWQRAFEMIPDCKFSMLPSMIPKLGTILGGNIALRGNNLTLACFHGINFRSKSWALFCLNEAFIVFATEAQKTQEGDIHIVQDLTVNIGRDNTKHQLGKNMATVCKISRGHTMPPTFTSVQEWFHYAFATSEIKDLDNFPVMQRNGVESPKDHRRRRTQEYFHDTEMIFVLPALEMCLRSIHTQGENEPASDDERPVVEVTFVTEFEDHIYVAMDAEVILFIHDLISLYIKEKDKDSRMTYKTESEKKKVTDPTAALKEDWREFNCKFWKLEPTVRLLHWASKEIDPVGVDYVLQKLGFSHARVTIPKWMQRGFMDPLDKFLSILIEYLITVLREKPKEPTEAEN